MGNCGGCCPDPAEITKPTSNSAYRATTSTPRAVVDLPASEEQAQPQILSTSPAADTTAAAAASSHQIAVEAVSIADNGDDDVSFPRSEPTAGCGGAAEGQQPSAKAAAADDDDEREEQAPLPFFVGEPTAPTTSDCGGAPASSSSSGKNKKSSSSEKRSSGSAEQSDRSAHQSSFSSPTDSSSGGGDREGASSPLGGGSSAAATSGATSSTTTSPGCAGGGGGGRSGSSLVSSENLSMGGSLSEGLDSAVLQSDASACSNSSFGEATSYPGSEDEAPLLAVQPPPLTICRDEISPLVSGGSSTLLTGSISPAGSSSVTSLQRFARAGTSFSGQDALEEEEVRRVHKPSGSSDSSSGSISQATAADRSGGISANNASSGTSLGDMRAVAEGGRAREERPQRVLSPSSSALLPEGTCSE